MFQRIGFQRPTTLCLIVLVTGFGAPASANEAIDVPAGQPQIFLDDQVIAEFHGLARTLRRPLKKGAVIRGKQGETIQTRTAPVWDADAKLYKIWLLSTDRPLWCSEDGLHWTPGPVPDLRTDHVVYDPLDPDPQRRFKGAQTNEYFAVSPDGVHWTKLPIDKVPSSDESNFSYDSAERLFIHTVKRSSRYGRAVALAVSRDFQNWHDYGVVFASDEGDQQRGVETIRRRIADPTLMPMSYVDEKVFKVDVYNMGVFRYAGQYIGLPAMFHSTGPVPNYPNTDGFQVIQLAASRDLKTWNRVADREIFIGPSRLDSGAYDLTQILPPSAPVVRGDELWFYYTCLKYRSMFHYIGTFPNGRTEPKTGLEPDHGAICLAVLRRDGFLSLDAGPDEGSITTKPFRLPAESVFLNLQSQDDGSAIMEVLNAEAKVVETSEPLRGDGVRLSVRWKSNASLKSWVGQPIQFRIRLRNAALFAFECANGP